MLKDFNILATTSRGNEDEACRELWYLLREIGDPAPKIDRTYVSGLIVGKTVVNPFDVVAELRIILRNRPYEFRYLLRIIPIEKVFQTSLDKIREASTKFSKNIGENETFRVTVEKRFWDIPSHEIIEVAAADLKRKVDLTHPNKILLIEVVGNLTGLSLIKPNDIISVTKEKML